MAKILSGTRSTLARVVDPVAGALLRAGISPDAVTVTGTVGVLIGAIGFGARGHLLLGTLIVTVSCLTDMLDGSMARLRGYPTKFGAFLDSSMDRIADGAVFGSVAYWCAVNDRRWALVAALIALVSGQLVSYVRARAEGLGLTANVGLMERTERLLLIGIGGLTQGLGVDQGMHVVLWILAVLSVFTVVQRVVHVRREAALADPRP
ncbi:CDP-diacylglycerol--glycerol-3-phosphate 3-phosphatidyltransferase [Virgisporangium aliadipatigenens]|uniref:Phosphatidylinositol phosphate synthase n=1 Tax=Virgisporangium aliadipatigenens TaxID=741659 RepID=A0A8J4DS33_9ACTN|nr:CDP-alcohol phosphatidyltransferase family protein [Virgisporangium aliadipatigenens]GIJ47741.1 CDP-diacylglycerol--glycerol-3-phosphate 3-phosphatidyltransferase [Virgisporangium aliadipatigenens]